MPTLPPRTINDLPKSERNRFTELCYERSVLQYTFSFKLLLAAMQKLSKDMDAARLTAMLQECVVAWTEDEQKKLKSELNDKITNVFTENGIEKTLRYFDPFGREKDYIMMEGSSTSFSTSRALPLVVAGVFEWKCPKCKAVNFTLSDADVSCSCGHHLAHVKATHQHNMPIEAIQAVFEAATTHSTYATLQARDVKEAPTNGKR